MNGNGSSVPVWVRAVATVGIPGAIALFLVYMGATEIPRLSREIESLRRENEAMRDLLRESIVQTDAQMRILRWVCAGVSKTEPDRRQCFEQ